MDDPVANDFGVEPTNEVDHILLVRLDEYIHDDDPWCVGFNSKMIAEGDSVLSRCHTADDMRRRATWTAQMHAARIRYLMATPEHLAHPLIMDCMCNRGHVYARPLILDGWHRLFAHRALQSKRVPVSFSGRVDLLEYLRGDTNEKPEE